MKKMIIINLIILVIYSCSSKTGQKQESESKKLEIESVDTLIGKNTITNEIAGSAFRKRATGYFMIIGKDSSDFMPIISEYKDNRNIGINLNLPYSKSNKTYHQRINELKLILPVAALEYNFDSLKSMSLGRLVLSGDLAIQLTKEYKEKFGDEELIKTSDYKGISEFLLAESTPLPRDCIAWSRKIVVSASFVLSGYLCLFWTRSKLLISQPINSNIRL